MYRNGKLGSLYGSMLPITRMISKKAKNKSCLELNFVQKSPRAHLSTPPPRSEVRGLERLIWLKYYFVLKRKKVFNLGLNVAKNVHQIKKSFK